jgi:hypothetical protein
MYWTLRSTDPVYVRYRSQVVTSLARLVPLGWDHTLMNANTWRKGPDFTDRVKMLIREREQVAHVRENHVHEFEACLDVYARPTGSLMEAMYLNLTSFLTPGHFSQCSCNSSIMGLCSAVGPERPTFPPRGGIPAPVSKGHAHVPSTPTVFLQERTERIVVILTEVVLEEMCPADKLVGELICVS